MTFTNVQVDLETLPRFDEVRFLPVDPRYPRVVLGIVSAFEFAALSAALIVTLSAPAARAFLASPPGALVAFATVSLAAVIAWYAYAAARVVRYAVREHDVIVHKGLFFKRETIQPIRRIQHVEQLQGPVARRFGLYQIKLFSAGTGHSAFEIPGLDAETAARLRQSILALRESKLAAAASADGG